MRHLFLLDGLEDFDDAALVVEHVDALKHLRVLASPNFANNLIVIL